MKKSLKYKYRQQTDWDQYSNFEFQRKKLTQFERSIFCSTGKSEKFYRFTKLEVDIVFQSLCTSAFCLLFLQKK